MTDPDHRAVALAEGATPTNPAEEAFISLLEGRGTLEEIGYAKDIYEDAYKSEVLEAFLLAGADAAFIEKILKVPAKVAAAYSQLFFDRKVFRDELDIEAYAQTYPQTTEAETWGHELKVCAITLGTDYLAYRFGRNEVDLDIAEALKSMITNAFMLSKATKLNPLNSNAAKEARNWAQTGIKAMEAYVRVKPATEQVEDEFRIALENIERTTNEQKSAAAGATIIKDDIVH